MAKGNWSHIQKMKGHKSGLETKINEQLSNLGIDGEYEEHEVSYTIQQVITLTNLTLDYQMESLLSQRVGSCQKIERNTY